MTRKLAFYEKVAEVPDTKVAELFGGELVVSPRPASAHGLVILRLAGKLDDDFDSERADRKGWWFLTEPELHLGDDVLVPDIAGWRCERMPEFQKVAAFTLAPDWLCEVLSPSTETIDRTRKLPIYAAAGVRHVWLVDPIARSFEALRLERKTWRPLATWTNDALVRAEPFEEAEIDLLRLWGERRKPRKPAARKRRGKR